VVLEELLFKVSELPPLPLHVPFVFVCILHQLASLPWPIEYQELVSTTGRLIEPGHLCVLDFCILCLYENTFSILYLSDTFLSKRYGRLREISDGCAFAIEYCSGVCDGSDMLVSSRGISEKEDAEWAGTSSKAS
jgi:hypothetical protein